MGSDTRPARTTSKSSKVRQNSTSITLPDRQLACAPLSSPEGKHTFGAMAASANYAWANRQMIMHTTRRCSRRCMGSTMNPCTSCTMSPTMSRKWKSIPLVERKDLLSASTGKARQGHSVRAVLTYHPGYRGNRSTGYHPGQHGVVLIPASWNCEGHGTHFRIDLSRRRAYALPLCCKKDD